MACLAEHRLVVEEVVQSVRDHAKDLHLQFIASGSQSPHGQLGGA